MRALTSLLLMSLLSQTGIWASETLDKARQMERRGDAQAARDLLARAAAAAPAEVTSQLEYAEFLDRYGDAACREVYHRALALLRRSGDSASSGAITRRLAVLDLLAGDQDSALSHLKEARGAGGVEAASFTGWKPAAPAEKKAAIAVPGPLRSFRRMAAIAGDVGEDDLLPALARNIVTNGYQATHGAEGLEQTEYLKLVYRYLSQARELEKLAGSEQVITVESCESAKTGELLKTLGFRMRGGCGSEVVLETVNASRAFLSTDSGFPVADLEQALRTNRPFRYDFKPSLIPVRYEPEYWEVGKGKDTPEFIDAFMADPSMCRLYLALSKLDSETADGLRRAIPFPRLRAFAHVLDFYGGMFAIRNGKAIVPGDARSAAVWAELVGESPDRGANFFDKLISKDDGWMASYFDALSRADGSLRSYLTEPARMKRFYSAIRGRVTSPGPARPVFRSNSDMMLLTTRMRVGTDGTPVVPGTLESWRDLFVNHPHGKYDGKLTKQAATWKDADDLIEALFGLSRKAVENEPLRIFMAISDLDRNRDKPLEPATVVRLARDYRTFGSQYSIFNDSTAVSDQTIVQFLDSARAVSQIGDSGLRANSVATMQALVGLWQIFCRQGSISSANANSALAGMLAPFSQIKSATSLFDAGRQGIELLVKLGNGESSRPPQDRVIDLLAGASSSDTDTHAQVRQEIMRILEAQRLVSLSLLFEIADHLESVGKGQKLNTALINRFMGRVAEIQMPRTPLSSPERNSLALGFWVERHIEAQRKSNLRATVERTVGRAEKLLTARGLLAPFLRDTLVGFNYAYYAPPGAQVLYTNPLFVRGHDFLGIQSSGPAWRTTEMLGTGWPSNGGGRLMGSLAGLPYALAEAEQNFLVPTQTQALIWGDLVPQIIQSAKIPRWWNVTPVQTHWVGLHMRYGKSLLAESAIDPARRRPVLETLSLQAPPARTRQVAELLDQGNVAGAIERVTPAELFHLGVQFRSLAGEKPNLFSTEIHRLAKEFPEQVSPRAISRAFGTPKPTLTTSYQPELLQLRTFPTLMGYSSRIMAESWESNNLYWAALADEIHVAPSRLNLLIPEWTQKVVERIFASNLEDWPALLRSLRSVGDDIRGKARPQAAGGEKASLEVAR